MNTATEDALTRLAAGLAILRGFDGQSESGFLALGEMLHGVAGIARRLAGCAASLEGEDGAGSYSRAIAEFEVLVEELQGIRTGTGRHGEVLERIAGLVRAFRGPAREFARANRTFRLLGLYVRVEASRLRAEGAEFGSLADDIAALAAGIDESAGLLECDSARAAEALDGGWKRMRELGREQSAESEQILGLALREIRALGSGQEAAGSAARALAEGCARLRDDVAAIVRSLQFQDISRQRLEHVCEGLERLEQGLRRGPGEGGPAQGRLAQGGSALAALQARQLDSARRELAEALESIGSRLANAAGQAARLGEEARRLSAGSDGLASCGARMTSVAGECSASIERLGQVVAEVLPVLEAMDQSAARIDETGYRIGLVSLNCAVKTACLGVDGAALGVVAGEMGRLAMATGAQAEAVSARLAELRRETDVLSSLGASGGGRGLDGRVADALSRAASAGESTRQRLGEVEQWSGRLQAEFAAREGQLDWARGLLDQLEEASRHLHAMSSFLASDPAMAGAEEGAGEGEAEWCRSMEARYTMASEREIHQDYVAGPTPQESLKKAEVDATFGDGIELF